MRLIFSTLLILFLSLPGWAQERVRNVRISVLDSSQVEIRYDLVNARPGDSIYVDVRSRLRGALRILPEFVRGDLGTRITAGSDRRIIWDALANGYSLNEEIQAIVRVKTGLPAALEPVAVQPPVPAPKPEPVPNLPTQADVVVIPQTTPTERPKPVEQTPVQQPTQVQQQPTVPLPPAKYDTIRSHRTRYAGPAWALLSAVAPGVGNIFVQWPKPKVGLRPLIAVGCYGLVVYGLSERQKSRDDFAIYEQQKNATAAEPYYKTANDHYHAYYLATRGAIVVAAADVILTFIKGLHNSQLRKEARRIQSVTVRPGLLAGQPTAVIRYSF